LIGRLGVNIHFVDKYFKNDPNLWATGEKLFDVKNLAQAKNNYLSYNEKNRYKPKGYEIIKRILQDYEINQNIIVNE